MAYDNTGATVGAAGHDAATIVAARVSAGTLDGPDIQSAYEALTTDIVNFLLTLQGQVALEQGVSAKPVSSAPRSSAPRASGPITDAGSTVLNSGKYAGKTVDQVIEEDIEYAEWFAESGKNEFMAKRFAAALAA